MTVHALSELIVAVASERTGVLACIGIEERPIAVRVASSADIAVVLFALKAFRLTQLTGVARLVIVRRAWAHIQANTEVQNVSAVDSVATQACRLIGLTCLTRRVAVKGQRQAIPDTLIEVAIRVVDRHLPRIGCQRLLDMYLEVRDLELEDRAGRQVLNEGTSDLDRI